ncbi:MAG: DNA-binding NarL/FixJ family response regulator, partial [Candidatus Pelagisphaera sp.]
MKSVVIIEDQTAVREMVSEFISMLPGYEIVGSFGNGEEGLQGCIKLKPETVILDVGLPELSGTEVLRGLTLHVPGVKVLVFSGKASSANIRELLSAGAQGYVDKMDGFDEFK